MAQPVTFQKLSAGSGKHATAKVPVALCNLADSIKTDTVSSAQVNMLLQTGCISAARAKVLRASGRMSDLDYILNWQGTSNKGCPRTLITANVGTECVGIALVHKTPRGNPQHVLSYILVLEEHRRRGIGTGLIRAIGHDVVLTSLPRSASFFESFDRTRKLASDDFDDMLVIPAAN